MNFKLWGGFHKTIYALRQALTLCAMFNANVTPKKSFSKVGVDHKMASRPTFSLYEIDTRTQINEFKKMLKIDGLEFYLFWHS